MKPIDMRLAYPFTGSKSTSERRVYFRTSRIATSPFLPLRRTVREADGSRFVMLVSYFRHLIILLVVDVGSGLAG